LAEVPQWSVTQSGYSGNQIGLALSPQREVYVQVDEGEYSRIDKYDATGALAWSSFAGFSPVWLKATRDGGVLAQSIYSPKRGGIPRLT